MSPRVVSLENLVATSDHLTLVNGMNACPPRTRPLRSSFGVSVSACSASAVALEHRTAPAASARRSCIENLFIRGAFCIPDDDEFTKRALLLAQIRRADQRALAA